MNGTNKKYYTAAQNILHKYKSHGILVYDLSVIDINNNNTKNILDPAPRLIQECKHFNKEIIIENSNRGLEVYMNRNTYEKNSTSFWLQFYNR